MSVEEVRFYSRGVVVHGTLYTPGDGGGAAPCLVHANGFGGTRDKIAPAYARAFAERGYAMLTFDYRGFGETGCAPADGPGSHVVDVRNAVSYLETRDDLQARECGVGVFGDAGTGGAVGCMAAALDSRIRCLVASAMFADGSQWLRNMRTDEQWAQLLESVAEDRRERVLTGASRSVQAIGDVLVPSRQRMEAIARGEFEPPEAGGAPIVTLEYVDELLAFKPIGIVGLIAPRPVMWICFADDPVCPASEAQRMHDLASEPKRLMLITDVPHYKRHAVALDRIADAAAEWFGAHLPVTAGKEAG
jgi:fermentation-respiration switch protein FrsA (DUF1100 family)